MVGKFDSPGYGRKRDFHTPIRTPPPLDIFDTFVTSETCSEAVERFEELIAFIGIKDAATKNIELLYAVSKRIYV